MLLKSLFAGILGFFGYRHFTRHKESAHAAFSPDQPRGSHMDVRDAGPGAMHDKPRREWTSADEDSDESFPASDPPGNY